MKLILLGLSDKSRWTDGTLGNQSTNSVIANTVRTQFQKLGAIYLHQRANTAGLHWATNEVVRRQDTRAWTRPVHVTLPQASGHSGVGEGSYIFHEKSTRLISKSNLDLGEGHLSSAATKGLRHVPRPQNFWGRHERPNESAESPPHAGTGGTGRLQNTQEKGRQFSAAERLMPTQRAQSRLPPGLITRWPS